MTLEHLEVQMEWIAQENRIFQTSRFFLNLLGQGNVPVIRV